MATSAYTAAVSEFPPQVRTLSGPGEFSFGEDQNCTETDGKKGHRSGTVGDQPAVLMTVQLHVDPKHEPCHMR